MKIADVERLNERERAALADKVALEVLRPVAEWNPSRVVPEPQEAR